MATNVEMKKTGTENNISLIKKFNKKVQGSGILRKARSKRYNKRTLSTYAQKIKTLKVIKRKKEIERLIKLGKMSENKFDNKFKTK